MSRPTTAKLYVVDLVIKVQTPERKLDSSEVILPVNFKVDGEPQRARICVPRDHSMRSHPAYPVIEDLAQNRLPEGSQFKVNGIMTYSVYSMEDSHGLSSRLKVSSMERVQEEDDLDIPDISFIPVKEYKQAKEKKKAIASEVAETLASEKKKRKLQKKKPKTRRQDMELDLEDRPYLLSERDRRGTPPSPSPSRSRKAHSKGNQPVNIVDQHRASIIRSTDILHSSSEDDPGPEETEEEVLVDHRRNRRERQKATNIPITTLSGSEVASKDTPTPAVDSVKTKGKNISAELAMKDYAALANLSFESPGSSSSSSRSSSESDSKDRKRPKRGSPPSPSPIDPLAEDIKAGHKRLTESSKTTVADTREQEPEKKAVGRPLGSSNKRTKKRATAKKAAEEKKAGDHADRGKEKK
ncbi:hypothetical protein BGZ81_000953 [Podila clonocystis]|nr:hypothetical protein BGZ81_000953 [Podila clonocystis]